MKQKVIHIPPSGKRILLAMVCVLLAFAWCVFGPELERRYLRDEFLLLGTIFILIFYVSWYSLYMEHLTVYVLFIPIRKVRWDKICCAVYIPKSSKAAEKAVNNSVILFLNTVGQPPKTPEEAEVHRKKHPFCSVRIHLPEKNEELYIKALEKCTGFHLISA